MREADLFFFASLRLHLVRGGGGGGGVCVHARIYHISKHHPRPCESGARAPFCSGFLTASYSGAQKYAAAAVIYYIAYLIINIRVLVRVNDRDSPGGKHNNNDAPGLRDTAGAAPTI